MGAVPWHLQPAFSFLDTAHALDRTTASYVFKADNTQLAPPHPAGLVTPNLQLWNYDFFAHNYIRVHAAAVMFIITMVNKNYITYSREFKLHNLKVWIFTLTCLYLDIIKYENRV